MPENDMSPKKKEVDGSVVMIYESNSASLSWSEWIIQKGIILLARIWGFLLPVSLFSVLSLVVFDPTQSALGVFFLLNVLLVFVVETWRRSTDIRSVLSENWTKKTPPHQSGFDINRLFWSAIDSLRPELKPDPPLHPNVNTSRCFSWGLAYYVAGIFTFIIGALALLGLTNIGVIESTRTELLAENEHLFPAAYMSALLGPEFGAIVITIFALSYSSSDLAFAVLVGIIPSYFLIHSMENFIIGIESFIDGFRT
ncbi:hypothetical protein ACT4ML_13315 [Natrinema sp. LN54]|uniref:hypothetical protein n=1 Tax=Natrinema sp. LN54 TaxID=3458705 RepID=UPI0040362E79